MFSLSEKHEEYIRQKTRCQPAMALMSAEYGRGDDNDDDDVFSVACYKSLKIYNYLFCSTAMRPKEVTNEGCRKQFNLLPT